MFFRYRARADPTHHYGRAFRAGTARKLARRPVLGPMPRHEARIGTARQARRAVPARWPTIGVVAGARRSSRGSNGSLRKGSTSARALLVRACMRATRNAPAVKSNQHAVKKRSSSEQGREVFVATPREARFQTVFGLAHNMVNGRKIGRERPKEI
jgi:hypothetical protein